MLFLPSLALALNKTIKLCLEKKITDNYHNLIQKFVNAIYVQFTYYIATKEMEVTVHIVNKEVEIKVAILKTLKIIVEND